MFIVAPTVISVMESNYDVSVFFSLNEEEEQKESKSFETFEIKFLEAINEDIVLFIDYEEHLHATYINEYAQLHLESFSPPPEHV